MLNIFSGLTIGVSSGSKWGLVCKNTEASIRYGVNTHLGLGTGFSAYNNETGVIDEVVALGFTAWRDNLLWQVFEASPGVYTCTPAGDTQSAELFAGLARNTAQGYGLHLTYGCLYHNSALYGSTPDATWRDHFVDAMEAFALAYVAAGYDPAKLTMEVWNEPSSLGTVFTNVAQADDFGSLITELYPRIKAVDSEIEVIGPAMSDGSWSGNLAWHQAMWGIAGWAQALDAYSDHIYNTGDAAALRYPESFLFKMRAFYDRYLFPAVLADGNSVMPLRVNEFGWDTTTFGATTPAKYYPRALALFSSIPRLREATLYELIDSNTNTFGLSSSLGVRKAQATSVAAILVHLKLATERSYYWCGGSYNNGYHAVLLTTGVSTRRLVVWSLEGDRTTTITVQTQSAGTLSIETIGSTTSTQELVVGLNDVSVDLTDIAKVLYADVAITFPEFT